MIYDPRHVPRAEDQSLTDAQVRKKLEAGRETFERVRSNYSNPREFSLEITPDDKRTLEDCNREMGTLQSQSRGRVSQTLTGQITELMFDILFYMSGFSNVEYGPIGQRK